MTDTSLKPTNYLEDIGLWHLGANVGRQYIVGFGLSLFLTLLAFSFAMSGVASPLAIGILIFLAVGQFFVQVVQFLHLGTNLRSRAQLVVLLSFTIIVAILVIGSLWVLFTLNARMMPSPAQMQQYMQSQDAM